MKEKLNSEEDKDNNQNKYIFKKPIIIFTTTIFLISVYFYVTINFNVQDSISLKQLSEKNSKSKPNKVK